MDVAGADKGVSRTRVTVRASRRALSAFVSQTPIEG